ARQRHPAARPEAEAADGLVGIVRAGRQVPALEADQGRQYVAIETDQALSQEPRRAPRGIEHRSDAHRRLSRPRRLDAVVHSAATVSRRLASIWLMASTTASKVNIVEAWPAL